MESQLHLLDYMVILITVLVSSVAGIYYGVTKKKNDSVEEYFMASRDLGIFKIACSYFATTMSSGALIGVVAEIFYYGSQSILGYHAAITSRIIVNVLFFPVFYNIGSPDTYTFYELRFNKYVRYFLSTLAIIEMIFIDSIIIYGVSSVLSKASGVELWIIIPTIAVVCAVYSGLGGVRGVTMADVIQGCVIVVTVAVLFVLSFIHVGGFSVAWQRNIAGERIEFFNFDINPTVRHTFWTATITPVINFMAVMSTMQSSLIRLMATKSLKSGIRASYIGAVMVYVVYLICGILGLVIYATYYLCDPMASGAIQSPNQIIAKFAGDVMAGYHGMLGLFYSALICAAISTISSDLNALSLLSMETLVKPLNLIKSDQGYTRLAKILTFVTAGLTLACTSSIQVFPNIYQARLVLSSICDGPQFSLLLIGMLFPQANLKSSIGALGCGVLFILWITIGNMFLNLKSTTKPISTVECNLTANSSMGLQIMGITNSSFVNYNSTVQPETTSWGTYFPLSVASYNWFTTLGIVFTLVSFVILSFIFGADRKRKIDINLIPMPIQKLQKKYNKKLRRFLLCDVYNDNHEMKVIHSKVDAQTEAVKSLMDVNETITK